MYYCLLTTLTNEGRKALKRTPGRIWEVNKEVEQMGAKIIAQYKTLGPYDFVNIIGADADGSHYDRRLREGNSDCIFY
jgi:uncharacterized protein with GYD domain